MADRIAVVTGGSKGIGFAIARALIGGGGRVAITARHQADLDHAARALDAGDRVHTVTADVRDPADAVRAMDDTARRFGGLDILVNNAGVGRFANVADMSVDDWRQVIDTSLSGVFYCCRAAIPHLRRRGGG